MLSQPGARHDSSARARAATALAALAAVTVIAGFALIFTISWYTSVSVSSDGRSTVEHETLWSNGPHGVLLAIFGGALAVTLAAAAYPAARGLAALILLVVSALGALTIGWLFLPAVMLLVASWLITVRTPEG